MNKQSSLFNDFFYKPNIIMLNFHDTQIISIPHFCNFLDMKIEIVLLQNKQWSFYNLNTFATTMIMNWKLQ